MKNVHMTAYALQSDGSRVPDTGYYSSIINSGDGNVTTKIIRKKPGTEAYISTMVKVCMLSRTSAGEDEFFCKTFPYTMSWYTASKETTESLKKTPEPTKKETAKLETKPAVFRVSDVFLRAEPTNYVGSCPVTIKFTGMISASGGEGKVSYKFLRSDDAFAPIQTLTFKSPGSREINTAWTLGGTGLSSYSGWQSVQVIEPKEIVSKRAGFKIQCRGRETQVATQHPERYIKVTDWSFYVAFNGVAVIHHVIIENTSDISYKNIQVNIHYSSRTGAQVSAEKKVLPVTLPPRSKKDYLESGFVLGAGSRDTNVQSIEVLGASPLVKDGLSNY
jgi:hypothetical protein